MVNFVTDASSPTFWPSGMVRLGILSVLYQELTVTTRRLLDVELEQERRLQALM